MKPRLLFLCQLLPYPPDGGAPIRTYNILRLLAEKYEVTALCFYRRSNVRDLSESIERLSSMAETSTFRIEQEYSRIRMFLDHAIGLLSGRVYTERAYESFEYRSALKRVLRARRFDLVHVDSLDLSGYLEELGDLPVICVHHNVESQLLARRGTLERSLLKRWYMNRQAKLMEREERKWAPRVRLNVVVSAADMARLKGIAPSADVCVVPNGVDADQFQPGHFDESGIVFVGGLTWFPNRDALDHLVDDILPVLRERGVLEEVTWVGYASAAERSQFQERGVSLTGYVDDIRPIVQRAACFVVPLRVGGGTRLKILDAWAMGKAVVSTSIGCEGLDAIDGLNILVRDNPVSFAEAVQQVLHDKALRQRLGEQARMTIETTYAWKIVGEGMHTKYHAIRLG